MTNKDKKANILLIITDQMVPFLTGAYGNKNIITPNLNKLVESGIKFDCAYSPCPICVPARASLMTGKYVSSHKVYDNARPLPALEPTIAHYLTLEGYDTVASGKLHYVGPDQLHGLNRRLTTDIFPSDLEFLPSNSLRSGTDKYTDVHANPIAIDYVTAGVRQWSMGLRFDAETHFRALEYIYDRRIQVGGTMQKPQKERDPSPFFLTVSYTHPHEPFHVTQELWDLYEGVEFDLPYLPENLEEHYSEMDKWLNIFHGVSEVDLKNKENLYNMRRAYCGLVTDIDRKIGELIKALKDTGLRDNTIIIFCSDHGDMLGEKGMVQKRSFYEWSSRVPLIINSPDGWKGGIKIEQPVSLIDILPTILDMVEIKEDQRLSCDGKSLIPLISGIEDEEREVYSESHSEGVASTCFMLRKGDFKYIYIHGEEPQLFNLKEDPDEWNNLASKPKYQEIENQMKTKILNKFNIPEIEKEVNEGYLKGLLIKEAMKINGTSWDYQPFFDASKQYWREG